MMVTHMQTLQSKTSNEQENEMLREDTLTTHSGPFDDDAEGFIEPQWVRACDRVPEPFDSNAEAGDEAFFRGIQ